MARKKERVTLQKMFQKISDKLSTANPDEKTDVLIPIEDILFTSSEGETEQPDQQSPPPPNKPGV